MRYDHIDFAAFDIFLLERSGAREDFPEAVVAEAERRFEAMDDEARTRLVHNIVAGLPGANEHLTLEGVRDHIAEYRDIGADELRGNLIAFLEEVTPVAETLGLRLCCHPDDPPFPLLGLPRIMSCEEDYLTVTGAVDSPANGITLCSGSLGARPDNDLPGMMERLGDRVHFLHLRNVRRESDQVQGSFYEDEHLAGATDMVALLAAVIAEERRRKAAGRTDHAIPMRPDHGQDILDDVGRRAQPGYPSIGRLKGLAELRGVMTALNHPRWGMVS
jgi:mannonate dehydratase